MINDRDYIGELRRDLLRTLFSVSSQLYNPFYKLTYHRDSPTEAAYHFLCLLYLEDKRRE